jgi:hypothetical protein
MAAPPERDVEATITDASARQPGLVDRVAVEERARLTADHAAHHSDGNSDERAAARDWCRWSGEAVQAPGSRVRR